MIDEINKWRAEKLSKIIKKNGSLVSKEQAYDRIDICKSCPHFGKVNPDFFGEVDGCTICGCPSMTKPYMKTMMRVKDNVGNPIKALELLETMAFSSLNKDHYEEEIIRCPDEVNRWEVVDKKYVNN